MRKRRARTRACTRAREPRTLTTRTLANYADCGTVSRMAGTSRVQRLVAAAGMTQVQVAGMLGMSQQAVSDRMRGRTPWRVAELQVLAHELGSTIDELAGAPA